MIITFQACSSHKIKSCPDPNCLHLLSLHECLASTAVWCGYFRVDTSFIRRHFPGDAAWCTLERLSMTQQAATPGWMKGEEY